MEGSSYGTESANESSWIFQEGNPRELRCDGIRTTMTQDYVWDVLTAIAPILLDVVSSN
jgi:hypothetical protein